MAYAITDIPNSLRGHHMADSMAGIAKRKRYRGPRIHKGGAVRQMHNLAREYAERFTLYSDGPGPRVHYKFVGHTGTGEDSKMVLRLAK